MFEKNYLTQRALNWCLILYLNWTVNISVKCILEREKNSNSCSFFNFFYKIDKKNKLLFRKIYWIKYILTSILSLNE